MGFSAAADGRALYIDHDCFLEGGAVIKNAVVSEDPAATIANIQNTPSNALQPGTLLSFLTGGILQGNLRIPIQGGRNIFVSTGGAQTVLLFFSDV
jgi:hypothetical protein